MANSLERRVVVAFFLALFFVILAAGIATYNTVRFIRNNEVVTRAYETLRKVDELQYLLTSAESYQRGYILTGDPDHKIQYNEAVLNVNEILIALEKNEEINYFINTSVESLQVIILERINKMEHYIEIMDTHGFEAARDSVNLGEGKRLMDEVLRGSEIWISENIKNITVQKTVWQRSTFAAIISFGIFTVLVFIILYFIFRFIRRELREKRNINREIALREERLSTILKAVNDGIWDWNIKTGEVYFSSRWKEMLGYQSDEIKNSFEEWESRLHPDDRKRSLSTIDTHLKGKSKWYKLEHRLMHKDGKYRWILARGMCVRDEYGEPYRMAGSHTDITNRKNSEKKIERLNESLKKRALEIENANKELEAFSYSVSHDLRAPLRHINGFVDMLVTKYSDFLDDKGKRYCGIIKDSAMDMGNLIDDLLAFSRTSRTELVMSKVDMNNLIEEVVAFYKNDQNGRDIFWNIGKLPEIHADKSMMKQVLDNLINNAVKYTQKKERAEITVGVRKEENEWVFYVRDNGAGFDMEYEDKLFGVFQRLHRSEDFEGTGIGLATVRRIVVRHGGSTRAVGEVDKGAEFYFTIPDIENN